MARREPEPTASPRRPGKVFWICVLMLVMIVAWIVVSLVSKSELVRLVVAVAVGVAVFLPLRERIWGPDWRERLAQSRDARNR